MGRVLRCVIVGQHLHVAYKGTTRAAIVGQGSITLSCHRMATATYPRSVAFRRLTDDDVRAMSVLRVCTADDLRSDCFGGERVCGTCGAPSCGCSGHFGHIELPVAVPHPLFPEQTTQLVPVPPTRMRLPNREFDAPLTTLLRRILRGVDRYNRCERLGGRGLEAATQAVALAVSMYFTSSDAQLGLCQRLRGKSGVLRQTLMGWRVNSCARAVIAPDPLLAPWEVGVPGPIADTLGLRDGDSVVLNRQPSLHRGSMMGHVVRLRPHDYCLSISPTVTPPYNADFDGDEMNLHTTNYSSAADARVLLGVENTILSASTGRPNVRLVQDACLAMYLMHGRSSREQATDLLQLCEARTQAGAAKQLHEHQLQAHEFMSKRGFSVGVDDFVVRVPYAGADRLTLGQVAATVMDAVPASNRMRQMVAAGSKGSAVNLVQLFACVGYQSVAGVGAALPHTSSRVGASSSFVHHSFVEGLTEDEFWMHASASREGMIQTAVKTADAGYLMRRMVKSLEDVTVRYDNTVRTSCNSVVQFCYGSDGVDPVTARYQKPRQVEPGEPVGILCAQAIGHRLTQLTLDTFHKAGIAFRHGLVRVRSLLDANRQHAVVRGLRRPYMAVRCSLASLIQPWEPASQLPVAAALECRMRSIDAADVSWHRAALAAEHGMLEPWQVAARLRQHGCVCVSDATYLYSTQPTVPASCEAVTGEPWAGDQLVDGSAVPVAGSQLPPVGVAQHLSEPPLVAEQLGIEAARVVLIQEVSEYTEGVDIRHVELLADAMTYTGSVLGTTRAGMRHRSQANVLGRACFETAPQVLSAAATHELVDPLESASSRLAIGLVPKLGSHSFDVVERAAPAPRPPPRAAPRCSVMSMPPAKRFCFGKYM